jgi:hypothetical protein
VTGFSGEVRADRQTIQHSKTMFSSSTQPLPNESSDLKAQPDAVTGETHFRGMLGIAFMLTAVVGLGIIRRKKYCTSLLCKTWGNSGIEPDKGKGISSPGTYEAR